MAVTSHLTSSQQYAEGRYLRDTYRVEGIDSTIQSDVILSLARLATPNPVPAAGVAKLGIPQNEPQVSRFSSTKAVVVVTYGEQSSVAVTNRWDESRDIEVRQRVPIVYVASGDSVPDASRSTYVDRGAQYLYYYNVISADDADLVTAAGVAFSGRRYQTIGAFPSDPTSQYVFKGVSVQRWTNPGQRVARSRFFTTAVMPAYPQGNFGSDAFGNPSAALPELYPLEGYGAFNGLSIEKEPVEALYPAAGNAGDLFWLS